MSKNGHNMVKLASKLKSGHTFTFSTLKVEEKKVGLFFLNEAILTLFLLFLDILVSRTLTEKLRKWQKMAEMASN